MAAAKLQTRIPAVKVRRSLEPCLRAACGKPSSGSPLDASSSHQRRELARILVTAAVVSVIGVLVASTLSYVHSQIDALGDSYTSFCNVNSSINCDKVLSSPFAKLFGIPVAWLGLVGYLALAALFGHAAAASGEASLRSLRLATLGVIGSVAFSAYMAVVSVFVLGTICLLCTGLYAVGLALVGLTVFANRRARGLGATAALSTAHAGLAVVGAVALVSALAWATWPTPRAATAPVASAADAQKADPNFYAWYRALPVMDLRSILRKDQLGAADLQKVVIVDFFDLECAHCRHNHELLRQLQERRPNQVELVHRHFPLDTSCNEVVPASIHPNACRAAEAAECAGLQGKLEEMLDVMFANQGQLFVENLARLAAKAGLDKVQFQSCLDEHKTLPRILEDCRAGAKLEITSTPTTFVQGRRVKGTFDSGDKYDIAVAIEADRAGAAPAAN